MTARKSLFGRSGLPPAFGATLLTLFLALSLSPLLGGTDLGIFHIPDLPPALDFLKLVAPVALFTTILLFVPLPVRRKRLERDANAASALPPEAGVTFALEGVDYETAGLDSPRLLGTVSNQGAYPVAVFALEVTTTSLEGAVQKFALIPRTSTATLCLQPMIDEKASSSLVPLSQDAVLKVESKDSDSLTIPFQYPPFFAGAFLWTISLQISSRGERIVVPVEEVFYSYVSDYTRLTTPIAPSQVRKTAYAYLDKIDPPIETWFAEANNKEFGDWLENAPLELFLALKLFSNDSSLSCLRDSIETRAELWPRLEAALPVWGINPLERGHKNLRM